MLNPMPPDAEIIRAADALRSAGRVAVLTGAGASAESGVPTFRAADGLWEGHRIEDVATPGGFRANPDLVWQFYNARRATAASVRPNPGHFALAALERHFGDGFTLVTQNVDGLHQAAGSQRVLEIHGSLRRTRCLGCGDVRDRGLSPLGPRPTCDACGGQLRPAIVWFNEMLPEDIFAQATEAAASCEVLMVVGTSAVVYPAANLIPAALGAHPPATVVECNLARTEASRLADIGVYGPSGVTLPAICALLGLAVSANSGSP